MGAPAAYRQAPGSALEGLDVGCVKSTQAGLGSHEGCAVVIDALEDGFAAFNLDSFADKREVRPEGVHHCSRA
ncbi:MAG: hypothetical protein WBN01_14580, partial [Polyangiales bacterium]